MTNDKSQFTLNPSDLQFFPAFKENMLKFALSEDHRKLIELEGNEETHAAVFNYIFEKFKIFMQNIENIENLKTLPSFLKISRIDLPLLVRG